MTWKELKQRAEKLGVKDNDKILISQSSRYAAQVYPHTLEQGPDYVSHFPDQQIWVLREFPSSPRYITPCENTGR